MEFYCIKIKYPLNYSQLYHILDIIMMYMDFYYGKLFSLQYHIKDKHIEISRTIYNVLNCIVIRTTYAVPPYWMLSVIAATTDCN